MSDAAVPDEALDDFLDKWRGRWPEWRIAGVFVPEAERSVAEAWFALLQEWTDAAWAGADPTPGFAKLGWWQEELLGWSRGMRRHPLGRVLQKAPGSWAALAAALPALQSAREPLRAWAAPGAVDVALSPLAGVLADCERALFDAGEAQAERERSVFPLLAAHALWSRGDAAEAALARDWAAGLIAAPARRAGPRPRRIHDALARGRLTRLARGAEPGALPPPVALWRSWRAARG